MGSRSFRKADHWDHKGLHRGTWVDDKIKSSKQIGKRYGIVTELKRELIDFVKGRTGVELKDNKLLIGFSRRAPYKRSNLSSKRK